MKALYLQLLIAGSTIAVIGLIVIQVYWINNTFTLREQDFTGAVSRTLTDVTHSLEKDEARLILMKESELPSVSIRSNGDSSVIFNYGLNGVDVLSGALGGDLNEFSESTDDSSFDQSTILAQSGILDDIMEGLIELDIYKSITDRIDSTKLDSLISIELDNRGIRAEFVYGVFNRYNQPELLSKCAPSNMPELAEDGYRVQLFQNDPIADPNFLKIWFPNQKRYLLSTMWTMLATSISLLVVIMLLFSYSIQTIYRQKKLSEIKNDFVNNMTHELKTPIATISLACEALKDPDMQQSQALGSYINMIQEENKRLGILVENVLRTSVFEQGDMKLRFTKVKIHPTIVQVIANIQIQVTKRQGEIITHLDASLDEVDGDTLHITNVIYNLIDNAIKYSVGKPIVEIYTRDEENGIAIAFKDNGIGISKENQKKVFDKLYRVPTGNVHNVKGFGLGLSYVKGVVEKHGGRAEVVSELKKGSTFIIHLPYKHEKEN